MPRLGINIDHVATLRQARQGSIPNVLEAAAVAIAAGADGITAHLREDRRHIQDRDIYELRNKVSAPLNLEMSIAPDIVRIATDVKPAWVCLVPEKRAELTTEGGLDVNGQFSSVSPVVERLRRTGIQVSLFVEADIEIIRASARAGAHAVEIHTGRYAEVFADAEKRNEVLGRIRDAAVEAKELGLLVNVGHGLDYDNVAPLIGIHPFHEFNIGFAVIARSVFVGMAKAVADMKLLLSKGK